jgi:hypothetical protein
MNAPSVVRISLVLVVFSFFCARSRALPLYADASQTSLSLVLCTDLDRAVSSLRHQLLPAHEVGADWLEEDCVAIDPCKETGAGGARAPRREWLHANTSALATAGSVNASSMAVAGGRAWNFGSLTHARVPEGLILRACAPNFDLWRRAGTLACDEATVVEIDTVKSPRGCPQTAPFTLIECLQPLQKEASVVHLHWRPAQEAMHFGHMPLSLACAVPLPDVAAVLCNRSRDDFMVDVPKAAAPELAQTSLVWYDFAAGYGCHAAPADASFFLSRVAGPNRVLPCPGVAGGVVERSAEDATECDFECIAPLVEKNGECVSPCAGLNSTCSHAARSACVDARGDRFFNCSVCAPRPGVETKAFDAQAPVFDCAYAECLPGTASSAEEHACSPCRANYVAVDAGAAGCVSCNTSTTGLFSRAPGGTECGACMEAQGTPGALCGEGRGLYTEFAEVEALFALYAEDRREILLRDYIEGFCVQGYACLPCAPGTMEQHGLCEKCEYGAYMPNFGATVCFPCAAGQNTTAPGQHASSACVCTPGFE